MKYKLPIQVLISLFVFNLLTGYSFSNDNDKLKPCFKDIEDVNPVSPKLFSFGLDIQLGLGIASSNVQLNKVDANSQSLNSTGTKAGPSIGATVSLNFFGYGFSTGIVYSAKGFQNSSGDNFNLHYFVIPLLIYYDFSIKRFRFDGNFGPYAGLLLSQNSYVSNGNNIFLPKNVDVGLTADVQGTYYFTKILGALLGVKYEFGGLNNLASTYYIKSLHTSTIFIYSGIKISL